MATVQKMIDDLSAIYNPRFVCNPSTSMVIEGFPRSSNTFTVYFVQHMAAKGSIKLNIGHHTHDIRNLIIGLELAVPCVLLIRQPVDAISSFMIYDGKITVENAVRKYVSFYKALLPRTDELVVAHFGRLLSDLNGFLRCLNSSFGLNLPLSADLKEDGRVVEATLRAQDQKLYKPEELSRKIAAPSSERELISVNIKKQLSEYLQQNPEAVELYESFNNSW